MNEPLDAQAARARVDALFAAAEWLEPPEALRWLGIDSPDLRWLAVRDYLAELRVERERIINRALISILACGFAEENAARRGGWPVPTLHDFTEARERVRRVYGAAAAKAVGERYTAGPLESVSGR